MSSNGSNFSKEQVVFDAKKHQTETGTTSFTFKSKLKGKITSYLKQVQTGVSADFSIKEEGRVITLTKSITKFFVVRIVDELIRHPEKLKKGIDVFRQFFNI